MAFQRQPTGSMVLHGIVGGIVAGIVFAIAEMVTALMMGLDFFDPLRLIGSMVIGTDALSPTYPLATAAITGVVIHMVLSAIYGVAFVYLLTLFGQISSSTSLLLLYGALFGFALWVLNFLIIAPIVWPQFTTVDQFWNGFVAHTFFFGAVLGGYVASVMPGTAPATTR